jgi:hypothetical protein
MVGLVVITVASVHRLWPVVAIVALLEILWLSWQPGEDGQGRNWIGTILRIVGWAVSSVIAVVLLYVGMIIVATIGAGFDLWGNPWDGR